MEFIDKNTLQRDGNLLVRNFLTSRWNGRYSQINYSTNPNHPFKLFRDPLRRLLLTEQKYMCCYCMRGISEDSTTLEHIVPKSTKTDAGLNRYTHFQIIRDNICLQSVFDNATFELNTPPFPLEVAYENLVASCNGQLSDGVPKNTTSKFCNNFRLNEFVEPLFYLINISSEIEYKPAGLLVPRNASYDLSIRNVNLNYITLERIRQVWYHISVENIDDIENATTEADRNAILTVNLISLPQIRRLKLIADFKSENFWNILLQYKWFYNYYRNYYPIVSR